MSLPVPFFLLFLFHVSLSLFRPSFSFLYFPLLYLYIYVCISLFLHRPLLPSPSVFSSRLFLRRSPPVVPSWLMENPRACASKGREIGILLPSASYFTGEERETDTAALDPQQEPRKKRICSDFSLRLSSSNRSLEWKA